MTDPVKALIIGAGHNGLVCGTYLAKAGYSVEIIEARDRIGGTAAPREFADGFTAPGLAHVAHGFSSSIAKDLGLPDLSDARIGSLDTIALSESGNHLTLSDDTVSGADLTAVDRREFQQFKREFKRYASALEPLIMNKPPRLKDMDFKDKLTLAKIGMKLRFGLGKRAMREFLRVGGANIYDVLNECFDHDGLKGVLAADAVLGHHMGPRTPSTVLTYLTRLFGEANNAGGRDNIGTGPIADALQQAAINAGATIRLNARVNDIIVEDDRAVGVQLDSGDTIMADMVVSNIDAKSTFLRLTGAKNLDAMFTHRVSKQRTGGDVAKLHLALSGKPVIEGLTSDQMTCRMLVAPDMRYVEHAFNHSKYGEFSDRPVLELVVPTLCDPTGAPRGQHVMSVNASFAPYELEMGWDKGRDAFIDNIIDVIERYVPAIRSLILHQEFLSPHDIEREYGITGGHWHHGEMGIDQSFMMRPVHGAAQYDTPIGGLFLCGATTHPGGGITGISGRNAATRIIAMGT
jgi:phytoene dehydrogenase-like protein